MAKMSDVEGQISHSNIADAALKRIRKYCGKKTKEITEEEKEKYKVFFEGEAGIFIIEKLRCDIIKHCKLPEATELRKKLDYNHDNIMIREETSIAEKIVKLFPKENIALNKKINNRKPNIWFEDQKKNYVNGVISKTTEDFEKILAVTKLKELRRYAKNILPNYKK